jgi:hypothetical protein
VSSDLHGSRADARLGRRLRTAVVASLWLLLGALLASCMSVPDSGPVRAGPEVGSDDEPVLRYSPSGPRPGADPVAVINGYLDAMRAYPANPGIVREFLTEQAGASWSPSAGTQIYRDRPELEDAGPDAVRIETELEASLTARGEWTMPRPDQRLLQRVFQLQKEAGEWRIANPAPGLLIPEYDFDRYYRPYSLYFLDPALRVLVPDLVYLPQGDQTATLLLRGLLAGPTDWLRGAVDSMLPTSDQGNASVPVSDDGVAQVQLGSAAGGLGATERELLAAQLSWTLRQVPDVEAFRVTVNGSPLPLEDGSSVVDVGNESSFDPSDTAASQTLYALRGDRVVTVDPFQGLTRRIAGRFGSGAAPVSAFAVERTAQTIAAVTRDRSTVEVASIGAEAAQTWFDRGQSLLDLQWDIHGVLWAVDRTSNGSVAYVMRDRRSAPLALRGDAPRDIRAFALSRDGMRLAVIDGSGDSSRLLLGRVRRPADGSLPTSVDNWREVITRESRLTGFVDVAWASPTEMTVVAEENPDSPQTFTVSIDGSVVDPSALVDLDVVSVTDAPSADLPTVVGTLPGSLFVQLSDRWSEVALTGAYQRPSYVE